MSIRIGADGVVKLDCRDNSCYFAKNKTGMRTNGGCRCFSNAGFHKSMLSSTIELLPKYLTLEAKYNNDLSAAYVKIRELEAALAELRFSEGADS